jgi:hypothetical protein
MKPLLTLAFLSAAVAGAQPPSAETLLKDVELKAAADHRAVFLIFHASW